MVDLKPSKQTLFIKVEKPYKSDQEYSFSIGQSDGGQKQAIQKIGFCNTNFPIPHHPIWDSFYPLMFITRNGGPVFNTNYREVIVSFDYVTSEDVVSFFQNRAKNFGFELYVTTKTAEIHLDKKTSNDLVLFGGGKDSRLILGMLKEFGLDPIVCSAKGSHYAQDIPNALTYDTFNFAMPARIVPAMMLCPKNIFYGAGLGEVHETFPWHQFMDISTPNALKETSDLFMSVGANINFHTPASVLPYNLIQKILALRYPLLHKRQISVERNKPGNSGGHKLTLVVLCHLYHGLDYSNVADRDVFLHHGHNLLEKYKNDPEKMLGFRRNYEIIIREIIALMFETNKQNKVEKFDADWLWQEPWIDYVHPYQNPGLDTQFFELYSEYAQDLPISLYETIPESLKKITRRIT